MMTSGYPLPELLAPAGSMERLQAAVLYGADAVYLGGRDELNLRQGALGFSWDELDRALAITREAGVKVYYCINAFPRQADCRRVEESLERLAGLAVDGLIVADPGVFLLAREKTPHLDIHVSTQANTASGQAALFWHGQGAARVNLARELDAREMRETLDFMHERAPGLESEVFVHGAMCLAVSGQCLLSAWLNQRPGNLGQCTHPCRFEYRIVEARDMPPSFSVEESLRRGDVLWDISEDEQGFSAFFSPQDLCLVRYLAWFWKRGVSALKIEGRMRTAPMVAQMVNVYRAALNDLKAGNFRPATYERELAPLASRALGSGFFLPGGKRKIFSDPRRQAGEGPVVARLEREIEPGVWLVQVKGPWKRENGAQVILPGLRSAALNALAYHFENHRGETVDLLHPGTEAKLFLPEGFDAGGSAIAPGMFIRVMS